MEDKNTGTGLNSQTQRIYTVYELTDELKNLIEENYPFVWITGEISNFRMPASKHYYFTLKDSSAQISCVMFRGQNRTLRFLPEDGMRITGLGRISIYEPRGAYQIIFEYLEPQGVGNLQIAFEQLKKRLEAEGLFHSDHKKPVPFLPSKISVVTSPTGAVIHDIIKVVRRRYHNMEILLSPAKVQGEAAEAEIAAAIRNLNEHSDADVIILARGGGSLEDFQAFNSETVARAVFESDIPIVSGVGHETDVTIADFVADLRAPTPSAAAEVVTPLKIELSARCRELTGQLHRSMNAMLKEKKRKVTEAGKRLVHPRKQLQFFQQKLDDQSDRLLRAYRYYISNCREKFSSTSVQLNINSPVRQIERRRSDISRLATSLQWHLKQLLTEKTNRFRMAEKELAAVNPAAVLKRGYSIAFSMPEGHILKKAVETEVGSRVDIQLAEGMLCCRVEKVINNDKKTDV